MKNAQSPTSVDNRTEANNKKIIFADFSCAKFGTLRQWLNKENIVSYEATDPTAFLEKVSEEQFELCTVNLLLGGIGPFELIRKVKERSLNKEIKIVVVSRQVHKVNIQNTIAAGAHDFVAEPFENEVLLNRILYHLSPQKTVDISQYEAIPLSDPSQWNFVNLSVEVSEMLSRIERGREHQVFHEALKKVSDLTDSNRTSLIIAEPETGTGVVLASSDDPKFFDFPVRLANYPEIQHVIYSEKFVLIPDVSSSALTRDISKSVKSIPIGSLMVFPVRYQNEVIGVLTIRRPRASELPSNETLRLLQSLANNMAAQSNIKLLLRKIYRDQKVQNG
ncbi:MAG: response regulator [Proteobacteria bacterium]|nr:response regulator [Pseudomonadota bacterium]NDC23846.1 response regulator [Pseudomonadota bacterium]NDD04073.1 response regulator [Pseudomonadota bacterium]NDG25813.1 response regulator [Pseudomonadota bacterium]